MEPTDELESTRMTIGEHLEELRCRLIRALWGLAVGMGVALVFGKWVLAQLMRPYYVAMSRLGRETQNLQVIGGLEGVLLYTKISLLAGLLLTSPWVFWQIWQFIGAGLYRHERRYVLVAVPFSAALFTIGALFYLLGVATPMLESLLWFNNWMGWDSNITAPNHVSLVTSMMLAFGICFQMPIVVYLLGKMGLVTTRTLHHYRRHVIVLLFVLAAFLTSPSPVDQVLLALPMWGLYELGVLLVWLDARRRPAEE